MFLRCRTLLLLLRMRILERASDFYLFFSKSNLCAFMGQLYFKGPGML